MKRGEIYYIQAGGFPPVGSEQRSGRPAVIVSNDRNNANSNVVEVVYLTTQEKTDMPTHVTTRCTGRASTILCEAVYSISKDRITEYAGELSAEELKAVNIALAISLDLDFDSTGPKIVEKPVEKQAPQNDAFIRLETERDLFKNMYHSLLNKLIGGAG